MAAVRCERVAVALSDFIASPDWRSSFRLDLAGQTKLRKFDADLAESGPLDRRRRRQAAVLALGCSTHHHKLCVSKFDTHDPTLSLVLKVRVIRASPGRAPDRSMPVGRLGHARSRAASNDDTNACFRKKSQSLSHGARTCSEWRVQASSFRSSVCLPRGQAHDPEATGVEAEDHPSTPGGRSQKRWI